MKKIKVPFLIFALWISTFTVHSSVFAQRTAKAVATVVNGFVIAILVTDGGSGYELAPDITLSGGGGSGARAIASISNGVVSAITVTDAGKDYNSLPTVLISSPTNSDPGLLAFYPFNGDTKDESGHNHDGTPKNIKFVSDRFGQTNGAVFFDGTGAGVMVYDPIINIGQPEYSICFWFNPANTTQILSALINTIPHTGAAIVYNNDHAIGYVSFFLGSTQGAWDANWIHGAKQDYRANNWYFVSFTKKDNHYQLYVNGKLDCTYSSGQNYNAATGLRFGTTSEELAQVFHGALDDIRVYNRALTTNDITALFEENAGQLDSDGDGIPDLDETQVYHTNPFLADTDGDGLTDFYEIFESKTNPLDKDTDQDGLSDFQEISLYKTNPVSEDTDGDGFSDKFEIGENTDPLDPSSMPKSLEISRAIKMKMNAVIGLKYQLQYSSDLNQWQPFESPFVASTNKMYRYMDVGTNSFYWRLQRAP